MARFLLIVFFVTLSFSAKANENNVTLEMVLQSSLDHFPVIKAALQDIEAAKGDLANAHGPYDLTLNNKLSSRFKGYFSGDFHDSKLTKRFQDFNTRVSLGYRQSDDDFPIYENILFTNEDGEASLKIALSLLRDRDIDSDRFNLLKNEVGVNQSELSALITKVSVQRRAFLAYLNWHAAGKQLRIYQKLLSIAKNRQKALTKSAKVGNVADITLTENKQFIVQRQTMLLKAKRDFENYANLMSLFLRDSEGKPRTAKLDEIPQSFPDITINLYDDIQNEINRVLSISPEIGQLENEIKIAEGEVMLGENYLKPKLDLELYNAEDFGFGENGSVTREGFESVIMLNLSFNLQQRQGRGKVQKGKATLKKLEFRKQQLAEQLKASLLNIVNNINAANEIVDLSRQEIAVTNKMEKAERTKFDSGRSDFFLVNMREVNTADARIKNVIAQKNYLESIGDYMIATLDFDTFKINPL